MPIRVRGPLGYVWLKECEGDMTRRLKNRNRKRSGAIIFPGPFLTILMLVVCLGLAYVWICGRCDALGVEIRDLEIQRKDLRRRVDNERLRWERLANLQGVREALERHGIPMELAPHNRVVYLAYEDLTSPHPVRDRETRYAQLTDRSFE